MCVAIATACHGIVGPAQPTLPLDSLELSGVPSSGTVGDRFPLKVIATNVHGETEDVTSRVTWSSSREATAAVTREGELMLVGTGETEIRASLAQVFASAAVSVAPRPPDRSTVSGVVSDSVTGRGIPSGSVQVLDGPNAGRSALTDESGFYSLPALIQGSFAIRVTRSGYESAESMTTLSGDARVDFAIRALPPPPFTGATFDLQVQQAPTRCDIDLPSTGRLVLSGTARRLTIRVIQSRGYEREYPGRLEPDGTFSGSTGLPAAHSSSADSIPHGVSTIKGLIVDSKVTGTEKIAWHLCPGGLGIVTVNFSGDLRQ
jgi:hypothetical protein